MQTVEELESVGLSNYGARAYYALLAFGKQTGRGVSNNSKIPVTKVFDVLKRLEELGLIQKIQQKPMAWVAVKPEIGLKTMIDRKIGGYLELENRLLKKLETIKIEPEGDIYEKLIVVSGFEQVFSVISDYLKKTVKSVWISSVGEQIPVSTELESARAIKRGVSLRFLAAIYEEENKPILDKWLKDGWLIKHLPGSREFTFLIFDKKISMIVVKDPKKKNDRILTVIENPDFASALSEYYEMLWKRAIPIT